MYEVEWERAAYLIVAMIVSDAIEFYFLKFFFFDGKVYRVIYWRQGFTELHSS